LTVDLRAPENLGHFGGQGGKEPAETALDKIIELLIKDCAAVRATPAARLIASATTLARRPGRSDSVLVAWRERPVYGDHSSEIMSHLMPFDSGGATLNIKLPAVWTERVRVHVHYPGQVLV